ncbi:hypothetical protein [Malaciobacter mytili]|nr:hypothetical protein [Malaciobacter mytili]
MPIVEKLKRRIYQFFVKVNEIRFAYINLAMMFASAMLVILLSCK